MNEKFGSIFKCKVRLGKLIMLISFIKHQYDLIKPVTENQIWG